jgi:flagellin
MLTVTTNIAALAGLRSLTQTNAGQARSIERLSSGLRINRASDDPSGLVISETLRSQINGLGQALQNTQNDINLLNTAEAALSEITDILVDMRASIVFAQNTGFSAPDQIQAEQDKIDQSLLAIDRIANSTRFGGRQLLNGNSDFIVEQAPSQQGAVSGLQVRQARLSPSTSATAFSVNVTGLAERATLITNTDFTSTGYVASLSPGGSTGDVATLRITGARGAEDVNLGAGATVQDLINAVNSNASATGVFASSFRVLPFDAQTHEHVFTGTAGAVPGFSVQTGATFVLGVKANGAATASNVIVGDTDGDGIIGVAELNTALNASGITVDTADGAGGVGDVRFSSGEVFEISPATNVRTLRISSGSLSSNVNDANGTTAGEFELSFDLDGDGLADFAITTASGASMAGALDTANEQAAILAQLQPNLPAGVAAYFESTSGDLVLLDTAGTLNSGGQGAGILAVAGDDAGASLLGTPTIPPTNTAGLQALAISGDSLTSSERAIEFANFAVGAAHIDSTGQLSIDPSGFNNTADFRFTISDPETGLLNTVIAAAGADNRVSLAEIRAALQAQAGNTFDVYFGRDHGLSFVYSNPGPTASTFVSSNASVADDDLAKVTGDGTKSSSSNTLRLGFYSTEFGSNNVIRIEDVTSSNSGVGFKSIANGGMTLNAGYREGLGVLAGTSDQSVVMRGQSAGTAGRDATGTVNGLSFNGRGFAVSMVKSALDVRFNLNETWGRAGSVGKLADAVSFGFSDSVGGTQLRTQFSDAILLADNVLDSFQFDVRQNYDGGERGGSGMRFQLRESNSAQDSMHIGIRSVTASSLGLDVSPESTNASDSARANDFSGGRLSSLRTGAGNDLFQNPENALEILDQALNQVNDLRSFLGSVSHDHLERNLNSVSAAVDSLTQSESAIRDVDFAKETTQLARLQVLYQANISVLATANQTPQQLLTLLR